MNQAIAERIAFLTARGLTIPAHMTAVVRVEGGHRYECSCGEPGPVVASLIMADDLAVNHTKSMRNK